MVETSEEVYLCLDAGSISFEHDLVLTRQKNPIKVKTGQQSGS